MHHRGMRLVHIQRLGLNNHLRSRKPPLWQRQLLHPIFARQWLTSFSRILTMRLRVRPHVTLLDPSDAMIARCADIPAERVQGRLEQLPFKSSSFDIVVCAWALETATCTERALCELCRMVRPGGIVCLAFCAEKPALGPGHRAMQLALSLRGSGRFLRLNVIDKILKKRGDFDVRTLPCNGPATALIARRDNLTK